MSKYGNRVRRTGAAVLGALALGVTLTVTAAPAPAAGPMPVVCDTRGALDVTPSDSGTVDWNLHLEGTCSGTIGGSSIVSVDGQGTSSSAGLCDTTVLVRDLVVEVQVAERDVVTGAVITTNQIWTIPVTAYPTATPFTIGGDATGVGSLLSRIFLQCGEQGSTNTWAEFSFRS